LVLPPVLHGGLSLGTLVGGVQEADSLKPLEKLFVENSLVARD
jgi:hypothetical protein